MDFNSSKFAAIVAAAKAKAANNARWIRAIDKAADAIINNKWIITPLAHSYAITTESGKTYFSNGSCQCAAYANGQPCKHRCAARLLDLMADAPKAEPTRAGMIAEIENVWPKSWPPLPVELMARFGVNTLKALDTDMLRRVRLAVAL